MNGIDPNQFLSIEQLNDQYFGQSKKTNQTNGGLEFSSILQNASRIYENNKTGEVKFSKHASMRLEERNIELTKEQLDRLNEGTIKASDKGIKDSLILVDELAFIVNVPNNTVITTMDSTNTEESVFTNIDGAVII